MKILGFGKSDDDDKDKGAEETQVGNVFYNKGKVVSADLEDEDGIPIQTFTDKGWTSR